MTIEIGKLRHLFTLQRPTTTTDPIGGHPEGVPVTVAVVWAEIRGLTGRERVAGEGLVAEVSHLVTIRYRDDVAPAMRGVDEVGNVYEIVRVYDPDGRRKWLEMETVMTAPDPDAVPPGIEGAFDTAFG